MLLLVMMEVMEVGERGRGYELLLGQIDGNHTPSQSALLWWG